MSSKNLYLTLVFLLLPFTFSCNRSTDLKNEKHGDERSSTVVKKRDDGTLSSVNQVDEMMRVHGIRVTYFADGKTIYTKFTFNHGKKHGPSIRYYNNGQIYEHGSFENGERHGLTRKYYKTGKLMAEFEYYQGIALSGLKEYNKEGELLASYPTVEIREINHLASHDRIDLEVHCSKPYNGTKYFLIKGENEKKNRTYLITEKGFALVHFYIKPGETLSKKVEIISEIPTELGNVYVKRYTYLLSARNNK
jgi:antitoxin component YwqK of YwqJK toxin-antitoxin module